MNGYRPSRSAAGVTLWGLAGATLALVVVVVARGSAASAAQVQSAAVIDRTYSCASGLVGGLRQVQARAHAGSRQRSEWTKLPYAVIASGGAARTPFEDAPPESSLAWISAGKPSLSTSVDDSWLSFTARAGGTIGVNRELCTLVRPRLPLTRRGLVGGAVGTRIAGFDCEVPRRVLLRLRAVVDGGTALRERGASFRVTGAPTREAMLSVGTPSGRPLAFADVFNSGRARLFTAPGCTPD
jgi:hypothetical protein